ncbi:MAG: DUF4124 domain-containing protein [Pseudomonadota bacterium]
MRSGLWCGALLLAVGLPATAMAGRPVFHWQDAEGVVHYADRPGGAGAQTVRPGSGALSIVDTSRARERAGINAMRPLLERELRWEQTRRAEQQRQAEQDIATKERRCARLRRELEAAELARNRPRVRKIEEQWYGSCR